MAASFSNENATEPIKGSMPIGYAPHPWKRYSTRHEFPLSVVCSIFLHLLVAGLVLLMVTGALLSVLRSRPNSVPVEPVVVESDGNGAGRDAADKGPGKSTAASMRENVEEKTNSSVKSTAATTNPELVIPQMPRPMLSPEKGERNREIEAPAAEVGARLGSLNETLSKKVKEVPPGNGDKDSSAPPRKEKPDGPPGPQILHQRRQNRWTLIFDTRDGNDYLRQLLALKATLAIPDSSGGYTVFHDFGRRPPHSAYEDINKIPGLHWFDTKADSVRSLGVALGLEKIPKHIVAFFPPELENRLRKLEEDLGAIDEDNIKETSFRVVRHGSGYDVIVDEMQRKR